MTDPSSFSELCRELFAQWNEQGAHIAAVEGFERGMLDAAEGEPERETLPYDIHGMYRDDYQRGYREGYHHGSEEIDNE